MKLSKDTLNILKNFSTINSSIYLQKGNLITTKSLDNVIYAEAIIDDVIDADVGIYDVSQFLSTVSLFNGDVEIVANVQDLQAELKGNRSNLKYTLVDPSVIVYPAKKISFPAACVSFELKKSDLEAIMNAASILGLPEICITNHNGKLLVKVVDTKDDSANEFSIEVGDYDGSNNFEIYHAVQNLKMIKTDYKVMIFAKGKAGATKFEGEKCSYIVSLDIKSSHDFN